jgi:para-nitrobenzyl esterase
LAPEGEALVTIAYRLGALGFLAHPELTRESGTGSGNYGFFDVVAALKWVQANIAQFGGDPSRVTIFGGSSGGHIVSLLAGAPTAKGLFQRAIAVGRASFYPNLYLIPPNLTPLPPLQDAEKTGEDFLKTLGASSIASARNLSAQTILDVLTSSQADLRPTIDGTLIVGSNVDLFQRSKFNDTPILVGFSTDEAGATPPRDLVVWMDSVIARSGCKESQAAIAKIYPRTADERTSMLRYLFRDFYDGWPIWTWARLQSKKGLKPAFVFLFDVHDPDQPFGAWHAAEYPYEFGNFPKAPTPREKAISALIRKYWINFAAHGNPNGPGLPVWRAFDEDSQNAMIFSDSCHSQTLPNVAGLKALDKILRCAKPQT